jgi:phospholipid/cholesterol/gamma-HCH transport system substrate-binding protein
MEVRASYLLVGTIVLVLLAGLAAFSVWLVKADGDRELVRYQIAFEGSVTGLQQGGQVSYRGVPVGTVTDIRIDPEDVERVLVTADIDAQTPIKEDTVATLELQGVTGIAFVQLRGGTQESPPLQPEPGGEPPRIPSRPSALERVFESTPELLGRAVALADRLGVLLDDENLQAIGGTLQNLEAFTGALARQSGEIDALVGVATDATSEVAAVASELRQLTGETRQLIAALDQRLEGTGEELTGTLAELRGAASALGGAASQLEGLIGGVHEPLDDFAGTGLYEFTQLVGETRLLIAALTRISKEVERDPAGFLIGSGQKGFRPE